MKVLTTLLYIVLYLIVGLAVGWLLALLGWETANGLVAALVGLAAAGFTIREGQRLLTRHRVAGEGITVESLQVLAGTALLVVGVVLGYTGGMGAYGWGERQERQRALIEDEIAFWIRKRGAADSTTVARCFYALRVNGRLAFGSDGLTVEKASGGNLGGCPPPPP
jgi:hypothetical protein